jgi:hypothetical protein
MKRAALQFARATTSRMNMATTTIVMTMAIVAVCCVSSRASAQATPAATAYADKQAAIRKEAASRPTPRLADGRPDLSGVWGGGQGSGVVHKDADGIHILFPGSEKNLSYRDPRKDLDPNKPPYKQELLAKVSEFNQNENQVDPSVNCVPAGVPRAFPTQIAATPGYLVFFYTGENSGHYRLIPTSGSAHPDGLSPTYFGDSVGHWEGDTLIVDVTGFNDKTWLGGDGWFHSEAMHVVERFQREGNLLHYQATVEDPAVLTRPWAENPRTVLLNDQPNNYVFEDLPCRDFDREHFVNHDHF